MRYTITFDIEVSDPEKLRLHLCRLWEEMDGQPPGDTSLRARLASVDLDLGASVSPADLDIEIIDQKATNP